MKTSILTSHYHKHLLRGLPIIQKYKTGVLAGTTLSLAVLLFYWNTEEKDSRQIFRYDGYDFKNASILGNPSRAILQNEESLLSKTQKNVLLAQNQLKNEIES